jgi:lysyl oxidase
VRFSSGKVVLAVAVSVGLCALIVAAPAGASSGGGSIRLLAAVDEVRVHQQQGHVVYVDPGVFVAAGGGAFDLRLHRHDYTEAIKVDRILHTDGGDEIEPLPGSILDGFRGLKRFFHVAVADDDGNVIYDQTLTFCPNAYDPQRVGPHGPQDPTFPYSCSYNPFTLSTAEGIDQDWGVNPFEYGGLSFQAREGHYTITIVVDPHFVKLFRMRPEQSEASVGLTVEPRCEAGCQVSAPARPAAAPERLPAVPEISDPDPDSLPDMVPTPAFSIFVRHAHSHDYLTFAANVWIGGNSPLDVEGFRELGTKVMDAYQYFYEHGHVVGRARAGTMEWDPRPYHQHWHFAQFARYLLLDESMTETVSSHKQGFCIFPTDGIDLLTPGADWRPDYGSGSVCGTESSVWVRETLPLGWGDTYFQYVSGQSFEISDVPNGTYYVKVVANPKHLLYETDTSNNASLRGVILGGRPGHRTVQVLPA